MSKAEERANEKYPTWENGIGDEFNVNSVYYGFIEGYHQAKKDLELTWEDLKTLDDISDDVYAECDAEMFDEKEYYQEVLNRFNKLK